MDKANLTIKTAEPVPPPKSYSVSFENMTEEEAMVLRGLFSDSSPLREWTGKRFQEIRDKFRDSLFTKDHVDPLFWKIDDQFKKENI